MKKGFTLVELLTVICIIAVLSAMIIPAVKAVQEKTIEKAARHQKISVMEYKARNGMLKDDELREYRRKKNSGVYNEVTEPFYEAKKEIILDGRRYRLVD